MAASTSPPQLATPMRYVPIRLGIVILMRKLYFESWGGGGGGTLKIYWSGCAASHKGGGGGGTGTSRKQGGLRNWSCKKERGEGGGC